MSKSDVRDVTQRNRRMPSARRGEVADSAVFAGLRVEVGALFDAE